MFYLISGTVTETRGKYRVCHPIPSFYLNGDVQGIVDESHAVKIASGVVDPTHKNEVNLYAQKAVR